MLAPIDGDTNVWDVVCWAYEQAQFLPSVHHQAVLVYLATHAFYNESNREGAGRGQVLYAASFYAEIQSKCSIRSPHTVRKVLHDLQEGAFIVRQRRTGEGHQPLRITVLWEGRMDQYREKLRAGEESLRPMLQMHPEGRKAKATVTILRPVEEVG